jgi:hypothetical protein
MRVSKSLTYTVRIREYETVKVEVGAEMTVYDLGYDDLDIQRLTSEDRDGLWVRLWDTVNTEVEQQQFEALREVADISPTANLSHDVLHRIGELQRKGNNDGNQKDHPTHSTGRLSLSPKPDSAAPRTRTRRTAH